MQHRDRTTYGLSILLLILMAMIFPSPAWTQEASDGTNRRISTSTSLAEDRTPFSETSYYHIYLRDVRIGKAVLEVGRERKNVLVNFAASARNAMQSIYRSAYKAQVSLSLDPIKPNRAVIEERSGSKNKTTLIEFPETNRATSVLVENRKGKKPKRKEKEFVSEGLVVDPFSAIVLLRTRDWQVGDVEVVDLFTGNKPYELELFCRGEATIEVDGRMRQAWEIVPQTRSFEEPRKIKLSGYVIHLAKDSSREILRITGKPKLGRMTAYMSKYDKLDN